MGAGSLRCAGNDNGCAVAGADAAGAWSAHIRRSREGYDRGYVEEFVEQGRWVIVTAAASAHVRTALRDKAFDEASSRGQALTLGDGVAYAERRLLAQSGHSLICPSPLSANSGLMHRNKKGAIRSPRRRVRAICPEWSCKRVPSSAHFALDAASKVRRAPGTADGERRDAADH